MSWRRAHPFSTGIHRIKVPLALRRHRSLPTSTYDGTRCFNLSLSTLSSGKPPVSRYTRNGVRQSESTAIMLAESSGVLANSSGLAGDSAGCSEDSARAGGDSSCVSEDSAGLLALANARLIEGSWSSCRKTPGGTSDRLDPILANSSADSFRPRRMWTYSSPSKLFSSLRSS